MSDVLPPEFCQRDAVTVARALLGQVLVRDSDEGRTAGVIVETEAYAGKGDAACHAAKIDAPPAGHRTEVMFRPGGCAYVYLIYGMYCCFNVVTGSAGSGEAVLIRALAPTEGLELMGSRRGTAAPHKLCSGPGKLCQALNITRADNGVDLARGVLRLLRGESIPDEGVAVTQRINVDYAGADAKLPYRFVLRGSPFLSTRRFLLS